MSSGCLVKTALRRRPSRHHPRAPFRRAARPRQGANYCGGKVFAAGGGRMTYLGIYPDTTGLIATLIRLAAAGVVEARATKIEG